jgi:phosphoribosyl 1,2-cyclic phosphodiesterase
MEVFSVTAPDEFIEAYTLFSGSKGNSVYIRFGEVSVLVDAGMSARAMQTALMSVGSSLERISAIFITHEHSDHIRGLEVIAKKYGIPVHAAAPTAGYINCDPSCLRVHSPCYNCMVGEIEVCSFITPHDSACSVGYVIRTGGRSVGVATDLGYMPDSIMEQLCSCSAVVLESNHDIGMLMRGPYPQSLKNRILSKRGHLSNADCADSVCTLSQNGVESILLAHLSAENNLPRIAFETSADAMEQRGLYRTTLSVAAASVPTRLI